MKTVEQVISPAQYAYIDFEEAVRWFLADCDGKDLRKRRVLSLE